MPSCRLAWTATPVASVTVRLPQGGQHVFPNQPRPTGAVEAASAIPTIALIPITYCKPAMAPILAERPWRMDDIVKLVEPREDTAIDVAKRRKDLHEII